MPELPEVETIRRQFGTLENIYQKLDELRPKTKELLVKSKDDAFVSKDLATIDQDVPMDFNLQDCSWNNYDKEQAAKSLEALGFLSLIPRLP